MFYLMEDGSYVLGDTEEKIEELLVNTIFFMMG